MDPDFGAGGAGRGESGPTTYLPGDLGRTPAAAQPQAFPRRLVTVPCTGNTGRVVKRCGARTVSRGLSPELRVSQRREVRASAGNRKDENGRRPLSLPAAPQVTTGYLFFLELSRDVLRMFRKYLYFFLFMDGWASI